MSKGFLKKLKLLDIYPKHREEIVEKSSVGAIVTIIGAIIVFALLLSEISEYYEPNLTNLITVNTNRDRKMIINFRIAFIELPCDVINIDVADRLGEERVGVSGTEVAKFPIAANFWKIRDEVSKKYWMNFQRKKTDDSLWDELRKSALPVSDRNKGCPSCYEGATEIGQCCRSCYALKIAFAYKGLDPKDAEKYPQCSGLGEKTEGCLVNAHLKVNQVQGSFHMAVGAPHKHPGMAGHHHDWDKSIRGVGFNTSHYISHFSFGEDYSGMINPLDGNIFVSEKVGTQQYFMQVVPTNFKNRRSEVETNQYSITQHYSPIDPNDEHVELPGVFFRYEISPMQVSIEYSSKSFAHFLVRVCAVIGGMWVAIGLVYSILMGAFGLVKAKKRE